MFNFDLHIHTTFSDGSLNPDDAEKELVDHYDFRTITDHNNLSYHLRKNTNCSFTGMEITAYTEYFGIKPGEFKDGKILSELLFYGFNKTDMLSLAGRRLSDNFEETIHNLQPFKTNGAKILLAHPYICRRTDIDFKVMLDYYSQFVDGFECLHESCHEDEAILLLEYCKKNNKIASGGSDSHGYTLKHQKYPATTPYLHLVETYSELFQWIPNLAERKI